MIFATLASKIRIVAPLESLKARLAMMGRGKDFPSDDTFFAGLVSNDMYNRRTSFYMLCRLTNAGKEKVVLADLTVEHVLPQKADLASEWQQMLGPNWIEIQRTWLHRLGNLTLTAFNSEFQAKPFLQKRDRDPGGYANSPIWLNRSLAKLEVWASSEIEARGVALAKAALKIWKPLMAESTAIKEAELEDAVLAANGRTRAEVLCPESQRQLLERLAEFTLALSDDVTEVPSLRALVYRTPAWIVELLPRANWIDVRLACDPSQLAAVAPGIQASSAWAWIANSAIQGTEGSIYTVNSEGKLLTALALIRKVYELVGEDA